MLEDMKKATEMGVQLRRILILDTAALISGTDSLYSLTGLRDEDGNPLEPRKSVDDVLFYTIPDVVAEVRDPEAKIRLKLLEDLITVRMPSKEALAAVIEFTKASGDYTSLSVADLRVIALAYMLEVERNGTKFLKLNTERLQISKPRGVPAHVLDEIEEAERLEAESKAKSNTDEDQWTTVAVKPRPLSKQAVKKLKNKEKKNRRKAARANHDISSNEVESPDTPVKVEESSVAALDLSAVIDSDINNGSNTGQNWHVSSDDALARSVANLSAVGIDTNGCTARPLGVADAANSGSLPLESNMIGLPTAQASDEVSDGSNDESWITVDNVDEHLARDGGQQEGHTVADVRIGCVTTDFAMQNTLLQMGIKVVSTDGRRVIKQVRRYLLRCHACAAIERNLERKFCDNCGNATLHKVAFKVNKKGIARVFVNPRRKPNLRGTKYSIPMPKGGRHNKDLILREDQLDPVKQRRMQKQRAKLNVDVLDPGGFYNAGAKFAAFQDRTIVGYGRRNPNQSRPGPKKK